VRDGANTTEATPSNVGTTRKRRLARYARMLRLRPAQSSDSQTS
jgi:hypothetical protein